MSSKTSCSCLFGLFSRFSASFTVVSKSWRKPIRLFILVHVEFTESSAASHHCPNSWSYRASFHLLSAARRGAGWSFSRPCRSSWLSASTTARYQSSTFDRWHDSESYLAAQTSCDMYEALSKACCSVWRWHEHTQRPWCKLTITNMVELWAKSLVCQYSHNALMYRKHFASFLFRHLPLVECPAVISATTGGH